jgi:hypothetical protein
LDIDRRLVDLDGAWIDTAFCCSRPSAFTSQPPLTLTVLSHERPMCDRIKTVSDLLYWDLFLTKKIHDRHPFVDHPDGIAQRARREDCPLPGQVEDPVNPRLIT